MRKILLPLALTGLFLAGSIVSADAQTNLCPNFDFGNAETAFQISGPSNPSDWNLPVKWVHDNVLNGPIDATGGAIVLSGGNPITNNPTYYQTINENSRLIQLGGDCGKVWALNYGSAVLDKLNAIEGVQVDELPTIPLAAGWYQAVHYIVIPDPAVMKKYGGKKLRCRMELNVFKAGSAADLAKTVLYGYLQTDQNSFDEVDQPNASANRVKFEEFYTDGEWDPTKWMVYEFEFAVNAAPENLADWDSAPRLKFETENHSAACMFFRNITIYEPDADAPAIDRAQHQFVTYSVGPVKEPDPEEPIDPEPEEPELTLAEDLTGNTFISTGLLFNDATTAPKFAAKNSSSEWDLPAGWVKTNILDGDVDNDGGCLVLSGDGSIKDYDCLGSFNEHVHHLDLRGTCGKVLAISFKGSNLSGHLTDNYSITGLPGDGYQSVWDSNGFNFFAIPDCSDIATYGGKTVRVRMELNIYENDGAETLAFKAWGSDDQGSSEYDDVVYAGEHLVRASHFLNASGKWDPTKWRAYEFNMKVPGSTEDVANREYAPYIKLDVSGCKKGTVLIRNIYIWDPAAEAVEPEARRAAEDFVAVRQTEKWSRYTVGSPTVGVDMIESLAEPLYTLKAGKVTFAENAEVFDLAGRKVANCAAGVATNLRAGFYVARTADGSSAKFVVR